MKILMEGNEAIAEAAVRAGCRAYFGYPITPQTQVIEYLAKRMPEVGGVVLQAESEVASINMVYGAAAAGARVMTSSSSPGISLMCEGFSYLVGAELPCLIVNVMRAGPGLGGILPSQGDYWQATRGGGHGGYRTLVLAPSSVQECVDMIGLGFEKADEYRNPVLILADGLLGQMMEPVELPEADEAPRPLEKAWATTGTHGRGHTRIINSLDTVADRLERHNLHLEEKYARIAAREVRWERLGHDRPEVLIVAYGTVARIARSAMEMALDEGLNVGMVRPISLWPFPSEAVCEAARTGSAVVVVEMNNGQMVDDVRLAVHDRIPVLFHGRRGGNVPSVREIFDRLMEVPAHAHA
jgi:2-oxoglutarate ferredoxin oxidoreductase subunit alpha